MRVICRNNFIANKVSGSPDKVLSREEVAQIGDLLAQLNQQGLVTVTPDEELPVAVPIQPAEVVAIEPEPSPEPPVAEAKRPSPAEKSGGKKKKGK